MSSSGPPPPPPPPQMVASRPVKKFETSSEPADRDALMAAIRNGPRLRNVQKPKEKKVFVS